MNLKLSPPDHGTFQKEFVITGSKSESNRLLLLQALYPEIRIENLSNSDDAEVMQKGLQSSGGVVDIHHAGTAMRFLTAYFCSRPEMEVTLTGSQRMRERPIRILVDALLELGADIQYTGTPGCPPLQIRGKALKKSEISLPADVSSQYISALLLIAPSLPRGLKLELLGNITSVPYIRMTLALLDRIGVKNSFDGQIITVEPLQKTREMTLTVESDWSSASYFYSLAALAEQGSEIRLRSYRKDSLQGDHVLQDLYKDFGVSSRFETDQLILTKSAEATDHLELNLVQAPDLAQTVAVSCFALGMSCNISGLHTLKIKETDRLEALNTELGKLGADIRVTDKSLHLAPSNAIRPGVAIDTYNDHRMAMAFAPLALRTAITIKDANVVSKSYPDFWKDMEKLGIHINS